MKWSEQMRNLESADQVYHECVVDWSNGIIKLNGKVISTGYVDESGKGKYNANVPKKYEKLFFDPFFLSRILIYDEDNIVYFHTKCVSIREPYVLLQNASENILFIILVADKPPLEIPS